MWIRADHHSHVINAVTQSQVGKYRERRPGYNVSGKAKAGRTEHNSQVCMSTCSWPHVKGHSVRPGCHHLVVKCKRFTRQQWPGSKDKELHIHMGKAKGQLLGAQLWANVSITQLISLYA